jgi:hypothetical protein
MADTARTLAALQTLLADNSNGDISPQDLRDMLLSLANTADGGGGLGLPTFAALDAGRMRESLTPADVDAQHNTLTVAQIVGGIVVHTSVTGGGNVTTDTAVNIVAGATGVGALTANGQVIRCYYINDGDQTLTFVAGDGVTLADVGQTIAINESAVLLFRRTAADAVTMYAVGA